MICSLVAPSDCQPGTVHTAQPSDSIRSLCPAQGRLPQGTQLIDLPIRKECTCCGSSVNSAFFFNCSTRSGGAPSEHAVLLMRLQPSAQSEMLYAPCSWFSSGQRCCCCCPLAPGVVRLARLATAMLLIGADCTESYAIALSALRSGVVAAVACDPRKRKADFDCQSLAAATEIDKTVTALLQCKEVPACSRAVTGRLTSSRCLLLEMS